MSNKNGLAVWSRSMSSGERVPEIPEVLFETADQPARRAWRGSLVWLARMETGCKLGIAGRRELSLPSAAWLGDVG